MPVELHLPDLPEVAITIGPPLAPAGRRRRQPWPIRLRDALSAYLPLLLMALLAVFTWWLVKNTPVPGAPEEAGPTRREPDYTMSQFAVERFDAAGRLKVRIEGRQLRHLPDTDRIEIDEVAIRAIAPDGRVTLASARRAVSNGDASEVQLLGGARVDSIDANGVPVEMSGEFLHAFLVSEQVKSHLPVLVRRGAMQMRAAGLAYDHATGRLDLQGPMRAVFPPGTGRS